MIKKTIHFNDGTIREIESLIKLLDIEGYGDIPKAIKFSVTYTLNALENSYKVIPDLNEADLDIYFSSIRKVKIKKIREGIASKLMETGIK